MTIAFFAVNTAMVAEKECFDEFDNKSWFVECKCFYNDEEKMMQTEVVDVKRTIKLDKYQNWVEAK